MAEKNKTKVKILKIIFAFSAAVFVLAAAFFLIFKEKERGDAKVNEQIQQIAYSTQPPAPSATPAISAQTFDRMTPAPQPTGTAVLEKADIPVDIYALQQENPDIYAWIVVPGTAIDYPVVQRRGDRAYYLDHNVAGARSAAGAIFTEDYNSIGFLDANTVIYGHNMKDGSMFKQLHLFEDRAFFDEYRTIYIYTANEILEYRIFAAYVAGDGHILASNDFTDQNVFSRYIAGIFNIRDMRANIDRDMDIKQEDRIVTLSTCIGNQPENRYLVQAVLLNEKEQ